MSGVAGGISCGKIFQFFGILLTSRGASGGAGWGGRKVFVFCRNRLEWVLSLWRCECAGGCEKLACRATFLLLPEDKLRESGRLWSRARGVELFAVWTASVSGGWQTLELNDAFSDV